MPSDISWLFIELGIVIVGLAAAARLSSRLGFSTIPLYLLAGVAFGKGGLAPLPLSQGFIHVGAEIGVLLLLFMLGLEYTGEELKQQLQTGLPAGLVDLALNFPPGVIAGLGAAHRTPARFLRGRLCFAVGHRWAYYFAPGQIGETHRLKRCKEWTDYIPIDRVNVVPFDAGRKPPGTVGVGHSLPVG